MIGYDKADRACMLELERRRMNWLALSIRDRIVKDVCDNSEEATGLKTFGSEVRRSDSQHSRYYAHKLVTTQVIGTWGKRNGVAIVNHTMKRGAVMKTYKGAQTMEQEGEVMSEDQLPTYIKICGVWL